MGLHSSKGMVKCLCRMIPGEQICLPQSDIERFGILHERVLNSSSNSGNRFNPFCCGQQRNYEFRKSPC